MHDKLLFPAEVEAMTRLSQPTIYRMRRKGKFPSPVALGEKRIAYRQSEIEAWLSDRARVTAKPLPSGDSTPTGQLS